LVPPANAVEKLIQKQIVTTYGVEDPAFLQSIGHLLGGPLVSGNTVTQYINGDQIFPAMLDAIAQATNTITFENFIWKSGTLSTRFIDALTAKAKQGVKVHCIVDGFGALKFKKADRERLESSGVQFEVFNP